MEWVIWSDFCIQNSQMTRWHQSEQVRYPRHGMLSDAHSPAPAREDPSPRSMCLHSLPPAESK